MKYLAAFAFLLVLWGPVGATDVGDVITVEKDLEQEIANWKVGQEVPHRLLSFPKGDVPPIEECGLDAYAMSAGPYIDHMENDALLAAIVFDPRVGGTSLRYAVARLVELKGPKWLAEKLKSNNNTGWEIDVLRQVLRMRFAKLDVACIKTKDMPAAEATKAFARFKSLRDGGASWHSAYRKVADENPDVERRKQDPSVETTLVGYMLSGWTAESGFSLSSLAKIDYVPAAILKQFVAKSPGIYVAQSDDQVCLGDVAEVWSPEK